MTVTPQSLAGLFMRQLRKLEDMELQHCAVLPLLIEGSQSAELREWFGFHLEETRRHLSRLQEIFDQIGIQEACEPCATMEGLIRECEEVLEETELGSVRDAALIAAAQCIEHHEIAEYGTARTYARQLGFTDIPDLLQDTLTEEMIADVELSQMAEGSLFHKGLNALAKVA